MAIKYKLKERIADKEFKERRVVQLAEISAATGIHRVTLSKLANNKRYNAGLDLIDRLCAFFSCEVGDLVEYVPEEVRPQQADGRI